MDRPVFLIHFLPLALRLRPAFEDLDAPVFVHVHGADITWDLRENVPPHAPAHPDGYEEAARRLGERVRWIANSGASARRLEAIGIDPARITVKPLGIPVPVSADAERPDPEELQILYLGRLVDFKGPVVTIRAFEIARERGLRARLTLAGDGPLLTACELLRERSRYRDDIALPGAVSPEEGERLRASADIFTAHSSRGPLTNQEEAFGVAFAEAMAAGLPVATGASGSLPDLVRDGETGLLFPPNDIEAHAETLLRLGRDAELRRRLGRNARAFVRERFSPEREAATLRNLLAEVG
jgi:glycosyltransferase involved in cell wall biosynthesis